MSARSRTRPASHPAASRSRQAAGRTVSARSRTALLGGLVAAIAVFTAFIVFAGSDGDSTAADAALELEHVHGLGVDAETGDLYAGTHYGLIRLPAGGEPTRVADRVQDFMGFTVIGPGHFLASGHPGDDQDGPSSVGLIESTDGGRSWQTRSLAGEADFHALDAKHGLVYGYNAGELMVSRDMRAWETRSNGLAMADLTVSPQNPRTLLATTQDGLSRSGDGGRSFDVVGNAPLLQLVTWSEAGRIVGVAPDGTVHASDDGGATWDERGSAEGAPEALATSGQEVYVAVEGRIAESSDGGRTFQDRYVGP